MNRVGRPLFLQVDRRVIIHRYTLDQFLISINVPLQKRKINCSPISNNEFAGGRPNMKIKVTVYVKA